MIACATMTGESCIHFKITSQYFASVREQLKQHAGRFAIHLVTELNRKYDVNEVIFRDEIRTVILANPSELYMFQEVFENSSGDS
jgi:hypothetical protein